MAVREKPLQIRKITIGNAQKDRELIEKILTYMKDKSINSAADAVRTLCEDALALKKAVR